MEYCLRLKFDEEPSYPYLRKLFKFPGSIDWNDKNEEIKKTKPKDKISDSGLDTPGTSLKTTVSRSMCSCISVCFCNTVNKYSWKTVPTQSFRYSAFQILNERTWNGGTYRSVSQKLSTSIESDYVSRLCNHWWSTSTYSLPDNVLRTFWWD